MMLLSDDDTQHSADETREPANNELRGVEIAAENIATSASKATEAAAD